MNPILLKLIAALELGARVTSRVAGGDVGDGAEIADDILKSIQASVAAYEAHTGQPIDMSLLKPAELIDPLPPMPALSHRSPTSTPSSAGDESAPASPAVTNPS